MVRALMANGNIRTRGVGTRAFTVLYRGATAQASCTTIRAAAGAVQSGLIAGVNDIRPAWGSGRAASLLVRASMIPCIGLTLGWNCQILQRVFQKFSIISYEIQKL